MFYAWGVAVDIAIIISRNFKAWKWYMMLHGILFLIVDLGTLALIVLTMFANTYPLCKIFIYLIFIINIENEFN